MNEENNFSINVDAETNALGMGDIIPDITPSEFVNIQTESELPELFNPQAMQPIDIASNVIGDPMQAVQIGDLGVPSANEINATISEISVSEVMETTANIEDPVIMEPTEFDTAKQIQPDFSTTTGIDFNVKVDAEDAYEKAEMIESGFLDMKKDIRELYGNAKNNWLPLRDNDEFEERPITEATNLIFDQRRNRMSRPPEWS
jgi:hypothetical protein